MNVKLDRRTACSLAMASYLMHSHAASTAYAQSPPAALGRVEASNLRTPQLLLPLIHTSEVQKELGITGDKLEKLECGLREFDKQWWPARIQPVEKQRKLVADLEKQLESGLNKLIGVDKVARLHQLQVQAQSSRALARPDVARALGLTSYQVDKINTIFDKNDKLAKQINPSKPDADLQAKYQAAAKSEPSECLELLTPEQILKFSLLTGSAFDTRGLKRVFPFAPELICNDESVGDDRPQLKQLLGKVVLIHFYAFQCSNCHANFPHYKRWSSTLSEKGVQVIGIQSPETDEEKDAAKVLSEAKKQGFNFPVVFDKDKKNWDAWGNTMWPTVYVIDQRGYIRLWWQGELNYQGATGDKQIENLVDKLLKEAP